MRTDELRGQAGMGKRYRNIIERLDDLAVALAYQRSDLKAILARLPEPTPAPEPECIIERTLSDGSPYRERIIPWCVRACE